MNTLYIGIKSVLFYNRICITYYWLPAQTFTRPTCIQNRDSSRQYCDVYLRLRFVQLILTVVIISFHYFLLLPKLVSQFECVPFATEQKMRQSLTTTRMRCSTTNDSFKSVVTCKYYADSLFSK